MTASPPVLAAGALCWKLVGGKPRVLVVHRTQHRDVSFPKGKLDAGETLPECAVREIQEETGLAVGLGAPLGTVGYTMPNGREKLVYYWQAEVPESAIANSTFVANDEIADLEWVSITTARSILSYPHDVELLDRFQSRFDSGQASTFAVIVVRHAKAVPADGWDGPDATRPLLHRGVTQAASISQGIAAYRPAKLISSTAVRCTQTMAAVARLTGLPLKQSDAISQDAHERGRSGVEQLVAKRLAAGKSVVLCSHGPVIPDLISQITRLSGTHPDGALRRAASLSPAEYSVLHITKGNPGPAVLAVETHGPAV